MLPEQRQSEVGLEHIENMSQNLHGLGDNRQRWET
jgi:hypothetical protein